MRMFPRSAKLASVLACVAIAMSALAATSPTSAAAADDIALPWYVRPVPGAATHRWSQQPSSLKTGPVSVVVHIEVSPLAVVGRHWSHRQRVAHVAKIRAAQDKLVPQIEALGGTIHGRFTHASAGLGVSIDAGKLDRLRSMRGVVGVRSVGNYWLDLTETPGLIGARAVASLGVTGAGIDVAVIDSGVDYTHAKLGGPGTTAGYAQAYCGSPAAEPDPADPSCDAHLDPDQTGYFGDPEYGRDGSPTNKVVGGYDWVGEAWPGGLLAADANPIDFEGHGTHVADIIGGLETTAGAGDAGVAPGVNLWAFKACSAVSSSCNGLAMLLSFDDALDLDDSDYGVCEPGVDPYCLSYDPADVINMSIGSIYGQPEDDSALFANIASYYGSLVVVSAGNSGDIPYIVGSPSTAEAALSVAQTTVPSDKFYRISAGGTTALGLLQPWSPAPDGPLAGALQYGNGAGGNLDGCAAFPAGSLSGKVLLVDRGACNISIKGSNGSAGGASFVVIANNVFSNTPPTFSFGGGSVTVPVFTVTQNDGTALKAVLGSTVAVDPSDIVPLQDDIVASSSRGPRIADGDIKPDIAAPGASVSAEAGTGSQKTAFGGTSGAAPVVAGSAALLVERLEKAGLLDTDPGLDSPLASLAPLVKSLLMNTANGSTYIGGSSAAGGRGFLAPITLQGAGRVDVKNAFDTDTIAWDITELYNYLSDPDSDLPCTVTPVQDVFGFILGLPPECAADFPFGNDFFNAWNAQTGSLSFGYDGVSDKVSEKRIIAIVNLGDKARTYHLGNSFRYKDDQNRGVSANFSSRSVRLAPGGAKLVEVTLRVDAKKLRDWTLDAGKYGNAGSNIYCNNPDYFSGCPTLTMFEYDGYVKIDGGDQNVVRLPWQVLPKKAAATYVQSYSSTRVRLSNPAKYKAGNTDVLALVDLSPNNCEIVDGDGNCVEDDYVPGMLPGVNASPIDIKESGLRSYVVPGLNAAYGLPAAPSGAINDELIDFGLTVFDAPFRASHNFPVEFDTYIDSNADGTDDYVVFNYDVALTGADGRNAVFVADINPADGTRPLRPYFFSYTDFNSQNWILPVPAAAIGVRSDRPFKFATFAFDAYFGGPAWDCSPFDCESYHQIQSGLLKYRPAATSLQVRKNGSYSLRYSKPGGGAAASPSQIGLLFMYRDAPVGRESQGIKLP